MPFTEGKLPGREMPPYSPLSFSVIDDYISLCLERVVIASKVKPF